jgi:3',5'-cyclic AMP phosphodiesterase CpdA
MILCQITDLHIKPQRRLAYGIVDTATMLERCVEQILALPQAPDAVIATGDLVDLGRPEEYGLLRELLAPLLDGPGARPLYLLPGNHDDRDALRRAFADHAYLRQWPPFVQYVIEDHPVRLVALDTVVPGQGGGALCAERLAWLDRTLCASTRPTIVALHHPPFATGIGHMDRIALAQADALARVIERHPQVERVIAGHLHRSISARFAGTVASVCPSPAHQVALDLDPEAADRFVMEPPGFQLHHWNGDMLVTHTAAIGRHPGPYPFREAGRLID